MIGGAGASVPDAPTSVVATRASATWSNTDDGWKILHTSYAPRKGKNGLPE